MKERSFLDPIVQRVGLRSRAILILLSLVSLAGLLSLAVARADEPHRVGLIVAHGDKMIKKCIEFSEEEINGYEVLKRAGLDLNVDASSAMGAAICRIDGKGCTYPEEHCFCQCQSSPCKFWIYWHLVGGSWQFSGLGASNYKVRHGDVEGWIWGEGSPTNGGAQPPLVSFEEICAQPPTATPTSTSTDTPTHTPIPPTATPTYTPEPTDTPTPIATPVIHHFIADRSAIKVGEEVVLNWDLSEAEAAYLRYSGVEEGVIAPGSKTVSPDSTTIYTLVARNDGGEALAEITITVDGSAPAPTSTPTPSPAPAVPAAQAGQAAAEVPPTSAPEPVINLRSGSLELPAGACTTLYWEVQHASAVYLNQAEVEPQGAQEVCPAQSQVYTLDAIYPGGERAAQVALEVIQAGPAPARPSSPTAPPSTPAAAATALTATAAPTPAALVLAPTRPLRRAPARSLSIASEQEEDQTGRLPRFLAYGGVVVAIFLFLIAPMALLVTGGLAWWLRRRR